MEDEFAIYIDRLSEGRTENLNKEFSPDFLDVEDSELNFKKIVHLTGEAYIVDDTLILHLNITAFAVVPCTMCNQPVETEVKILGLYHAVPLAEIQGAKYIIRELLRESILLDAPQFSECNHGNCPQRKEMEQFLHRETSEDTYNPFKDL